MDTHIAGMGGTVTQTMQEQVVMARNPPGTHIIKIVHHEFQTEAGGQIKPRWVVREKNGQDKKPGTYTFTKNMEKLSGTVVISCCLRARRSCMLSSCYPNMSACDELPTCTLPLAQCRLG